MLIAGVDEAGRGCVLGPMVLCVALVDKFQEFQLRDLGVRDSKKLAPSKREVLFPKIAELCQLRTAVITAGELNVLMNRYSLNEIEAQKTAELVNGLEIKPATLYADSPDNPPINFARRIEKYLDVRSRALKLVSENKADDTYPIVAAASIIAKVTRDREIEKIKRIVGFDFNSGYTSDAITVEFLEKHGEEAKVKPYIRTHWKTAVNAKQRKLGEF